MSTRTKLSCIAILTSTLAVNTAFAEADLEFEEVSGTEECKSIAGTGDATADKALIKLPASSTEVHVRWEKAKKGVKLKKSNEYFVLEKPSGHPSYVGTLTFKLPTGTFECTYTLFRAKSAAKSNAKKSDDVPYQEYDALAYQWWLEQGDFALEELKWILESDRRPREGKRLPRHYLVHLPSGAVVAPYPSDITEGERTQIVIIVPTKQVMATTLKVKQCKVPQTFRAKLEVDEKQALVAADVDFQLRALGPMLRCGPEALEYDIETVLQKKTGGGEAKSTTSQRLRVNEKYHIAAIFAVGWDSSRNNEYFTRTETVIGQEQMLIDWRSSTEGAIVYIGAQWMICGVDYHNMRPWNYFANLWVAVNPVSPLKDLAAGLALTPTGGIGIAVGMTFHQKTRLDNGFEVGDQLTGNGAIPTSRAWAGMKPGVFIGFSIDSNIWRAVRSLKE